MMMTTTMTVNVLATMVEPNNRRECLLAKIILAHHNTETFTIGLIWSRLFINPLKIWDRGKPSSCSRLMILFRMFVMKMIVWRWWGWWWWWRWMKRGLRQLDGCSRLILTDVGQQSATPTQLQRLRLIVVKLFGFSTYRLHWCVCTQIQSICSTLHYAASHVNRYFGNF